MNSKDLKKMMEIMNSLEPMNPRSVLIDDLFENKRQENTNLEMENSKLFLKRRKSSLPPTPSLSAYQGCYNTGRRQSLFQNEKIYSNNTLQKLSNQVNTNEITEHSPDILHSKNISDDYILSQNSLRNFRNSNAYDSIHRTSNTSVKDSLNEDPEKSAEHNKDPLSYVIDGRKTKNLVHRNSLELMKMKEQKHPKSPKIILDSIIVEEKKDINIEPVSSPRSIENSSCNESIDKDTDQSSIGSLSDQFDSRILRAIPFNDTIDMSDSFSDRSTSNVGSFSEKKTVSQTMQSPLPCSPLFTQKTPDTETDLDRRNEDIGKPNLISSILSEEEQNKFYRRMSSKISLDTFSIKEIIKIYMRNGFFSAQIIDKFQTAGTVCKNLKQKYLIPEGRFCQIIEVITKESLERPLEDHESILDIFASWKGDNVSNRFLFDENPHPYRIFDQPSVPLEECEHNFEISDLMWIKAINAKWMRVTCFIKGNCIYYSSRLGSKDQKDLYCLTNMKTADVYTCCDLKRIKKEIKAPSMELIVFKENKVDHRSNENAYIAPISQQQKERWLEAITVAKFTFQQLKQNQSEYRSRLFSDIKGNLSIDNPSVESKYIKEASSI